MWKVFGIWSTHAKSQSEESLALFAEKWRKGAEGVDFSVNKLKHKVRGLYGPSGEGGAETKWESSVSLKFFHAQEAGTPRKQSALFSGGSSFSCTFSHWVNFWFVQQTFQKHRVSIWCKSFPLWGHVLTSPFASVTSCSEGTLDSLSS